MKTSHKIPKYHGIDGFIALSDSDKQRVVQQAVASKSRPLTKQERALFEKFRKKAKAARRGRPQIGEGAERIPITVERGLLKRAEALAQSRGMKRSELFAAGVTALLDNPKLLKRKGAA